MKSTELSIETSKRSRGEPATAPASGAMPNTEETFVDQTIIVDPSGGANDVDPTVTSPLSLRAMMESFMTTQAAYGQLLNELLTKVASLRANFAEYRSVFPPSSPSDD